MQGSNEGWITVDGALSVPEGIWLFRVEKEFLGLQEHTGSVVATRNGKTAVIGGHFHFDLPKVIAYRAIPL